MSNWYENGELPPANIECEVEIGCEGFGWCRIVHHNRCASWIVTKSDDRIIRNDLAKFRPIKSEREKVIDAAVTVMQETYSNATFTDVAEELYKAGLLRVKPDA